MNSPVLQSIENRGESGGCTADYPFVGQKGVLLKTDGGNGPGAQKVGAELAGGGCAVGGTGKGLEQCVGNSIGVAAVVQTAAGPEQVGHVPVGGHTDFSVIEVKIPGSQCRQIFLPGQGLDGDLPVQQRQVFRNKFGAGQPETVAFVDQERQVLHLAGIGSGGGQVIERLLIAVCGTQVLRIQGGQRGDGEGRGQSIAGEKGAGHHIPLDAAAESGAGLCGGENAFPGVEADKLEFENHKIMSDYCSP